MICNFSFLIEIAVLIHQFKNQETANPEMEMEFEEGQDHEQTMNAPAAMSGSSKKKSLFRNEKKIYLSNVSYQKMDLIEVITFIYFQFD